MKKILPLIFIIASIISYSQTTVGGTISSNTTYTLANSPYQVTSSLTVNAGITLTIESGVEIRFNDNLELQVNGTLSADGVTFTSSNASPTAGIWQGIDISNQNAQTMTSCQVLYAVNGIEIVGADIDISGSSFTSISGHAIYADHSITDLRNTITAANITIAGTGTRGIFVDRGNLNVSNANFTNVNNNGIYFSDDAIAGETATASSSVSNTTFSDATFSAIVFNGGAVSITDVTFSNNRYPLEFINEADVTYAGTNSFDNNDFDAVWINFNSINNDFNLRNATIPYYLSQGIKVENATETTIESGSVLKLQPGVIINVEGKLTADANVGEDIILTTWYDDNVGGDTNGDSNDTAPSTSGGGWSGIHFQSNSDNTSSISGATLKWVQSYGAIRTNSASPTIDNNLITNCYYGGEFLGASSPTFSNNEIAASDRTPIAMTLDANPIFSNNSFSSSDNEYDAIGLLGSELTRDNTLPQRNFTDIDNVTYVLLGSVDIPVGTSLTIDPGVVIKSDGAHNIEVQGELIADGNVADGPIVFTSVNDDNYGNPLDTRNDGTERIPTIGNFGGIYFGENALSTSLLDSVTIKFANYSSEFQQQVAPTGGGLRRYYYSSAIAINQSEPTISNTEITDANYGIDIRGLASPVLSSNEIRNTEFAPFRQAIQSTPAYSGNTFTSVGWKGVAILPEFINYTATLSKQSVAGFDNILYIITDLDINEGAQVTIEDGIYIKMDQFDYIEVFGGLNITGTAENPVTITTIADDNTGPFIDPLDNDTQGNGNATDPSTTKWASILFYETSDDAFSNISHTKLLYGGNDRAPIWWRNAAASIDNVEISFSQNHGLYFEGSSTPTVDAVSISTSRVDPLAMSYFADPTFTNITFDANGSNGIFLFDTQLNSNATLAKRDIAGISNIAYIMNDLRIDNGATLTINPGVVLKLSRNDITVFEGAIQAVGNTTEKIIFTSLKDDSRGGDTNIDGNGSVPAPNDWDGIAFRESTLQSQLQYVEFRYGGDALPGSGDRDHEGTIISENNNLSVDNCIVQLTSSSAFGVYGTSTASFTNNQLENVARFPVHMAMFSNPTFTGNTMENVAWFAIAIQDEAYNQTATFPFRSFAGVDSVTYYPTTISGSAMTINSGTKITVPPGMHFKTTSETIFEINGELHIAGTEEDPVVFTEFADDDYGRPRDTQNNGLPTSISWHGKVFDFNNISDDASLIEHTIIRYKDRTATLESASPTFDNNLMEYANWGITATGISEPTYTNNTFKDLNYTPFATSLVAYPITTSGNVLEGTTWKAIQINNETLTQDTTLYKRAFAGIDNIPYTFNRYTVGLGVKMTIDPGVILKFTDGARGFNTGSDGWLEVKGALEANGGPNSDETIVFTSMRDDFFGGDTNSDSTYTTSIYDEWDGISFTNESSDSESILSNVIIRGADNYGVELESASPTISNSLFWQNGRSSSNGGLYITGASNPTLSNNDFIDNSYLSGTTVQGFGINNTGTFTIDATDSWWGDNSGPYHATLNTVGEGDQVLGTVTFDPWATDNSLNPITGDVSLNGRVSAYDAALTLQDVAAVITFEARQDRAGDVSGDGTVSAMDASYILQFAAGIIQSFPAEAENKRVDESFVSTHSEAIVAFGNGDISEEYGEVSIPISVSNVKQMHALSMTLPLGEYLELVDFEVNDQLSFSPTQHITEDNEFTLAFGLIDGLQNDFELGTLKLKLNSEKVHISVIDLIPSEVVGNETDIASSSVNGQIYMASAILSAKELSGINVYPNPTVNRAVITMSELSQEEVNVQVIDVSGKVMMSRRKPIGDHQLTLSNLQLNPGVYIVKIMGETKQFEQQLIISQ